MYTAAPVPSPYAAYDPLQLSLSSPQANIVAGVLGWILFESLLIVCMLPGVATTQTFAGFFFVKTLGFVPAVGIATAGKALGTILSFLVGRRFLRLWVQRNLVDAFPTLQALASAVDLHPHKVSYARKMLALIRCRITGASSLCRS